MQRSPPAALPRCSYEAWPAASHPQSPSFRAPVSRAREGTPSAALRALPGLDARYVPAVAEALGLLGCLAGRNAGACMIGYCISPGGTRSGPCVELGAGPDAASRSAGVVAVPWLR